MQTDRLISAVCAHVGSCLGLRPLGGIDIAFDAAQDGWGPLFWPSSARYEVQTRKSGRWRFRRSEPGKMETGGQPRATRAARNFPSVRYVSLLTIACMTSSHPSAGVCRTANRPHQRNDHRRNYIRDRYPSKEECWPAKKGGPADQIARHPTCPTLRGGQIRQALLPAGPRSDTEHPGNWRRGRDNVRRLQKEIYAHNATPRLRDLRFRHLLGVCQ